MSQDNVGYTLASCYALIRSLAFGASWFLGPSYLFLPCIRTELTAELHKGKLYCQHGSVMFIRVLFLGSRVALENHSNRKLLTHRSTKRKIRSLPKVIAPMY